MANQVATAAKRAVSSKLRAYSCLPQLLLQIVNDRLCYRLTIADWMEPMCLTSLRQEGDHRVAPLDPPDPQPWKVQAVRRRPVTVRRRADHQPEVRAHRIAFETFPDYKVMAGCDVHGAQAPRYQWFVAVHIFCPQPASIRRCGDR